MIAIQLNNIHLVLGARTIFKQLSWEIQDHQRIGLIGPNGAGKSSLLKVITGEYTPELGGSVTRAKGITTGYLPQTPDIDPGKTAYEWVLDGQVRWQEVAEDLQQIEDRLGDPDVYSDMDQLAKVLDRQQALLGEFERLGGDQLPQHLCELLRGLGLSDEDMDKPSGKLSGGQKKLAGLAHILAQHPPVLLLDEPDNHLDLKGKEYLEGLIREYPGAVVLISHDRYLLDAVVTHIAELEDGKLIVYQGDYSGYVADKEERLARQDELFHVQQREIQRLEAAIKRYSIWAKQYDNEKFAIRARSIQNRLDKMPKIDQPVLQRRRMGLELNGWRGSTKVLEMTGITKSFENRQSDLSMTGKGEGLAQIVLDQIDLLIRHGERVGLIGENGAGKSVLLRLILGTEAPDQGEVRLGPSIRMGYYAQEHETLNFNQTLLDAVRRAGMLSEAQATAFLMRYLFQYRQVTQKIADLSGGERSRLQLALLVLSDANFLLLDEPTNNLDIVSAEVLENALEDFQGTVLVVSHDRYFLDRTVDRLLILVNGKLKEIQGNYSDYLLQISQARRGVQPS